MAQPGSCLFSPHSAGAKHWQWPASCSHIHPDPAVFLRPPRLVLPVSPHLFLHGDTQSACYLRGTLVELAFLLGCLHKPRSQEAKESKKLKLQLLNLILRADTGFVFFFCNAEHMTACSMLVGPEYSLQQVFIQRCIRLARTSVFLRSVFCTAGLVLSHLGTDRYGLISKPFSRDAFTPTAW